MKKKLGMFFSRVFAKVWGPGLNVFFPTRMVDSYGRVNVGLYIYVYIYRLLVGGGCKDFLIFTGILKER